MPSSLSSLSLFSPDHPLHSIHPFPSHVFLPLSPFNSIPLDGWMVQLLNLSSHKVSSLYRQNKKANRLRWTTGWRRRHRKVRSETVHKRARKRGGRTYKAISGLSIEELRRRRAQKPEARKAAQSEQLQKLKEARKAAKAERRAARADRKAGAAFVKVPKQVRQARMRAGGGLR